MPYFKTHPISINIEILLFDFREPLLELACCNTAVTHLKIVPLNSAFSACGDDFSKQGSLCTGLVTARRTFYSLDVFHELSETVYACPFLGRCL